MMNADCIISELPVEAKIIPLRVVSDALGTSDRTTVRICKRFGIPIVTLSRQTRGLTGRAYVELITKGTAA